MQLRRVIWLLEYTGHGRDAMIVVVRKERRVVADARDVGIRSRRLKGEVKK